MTLDLCQAFRGGEAMAQCLDSAAVQRRPISAAGQVGVFARTGITPDRNDGCR